MVPDQTVKRASGRKRKARHREATTWKAVGGGGLRLPVIQCPREPTESMDRRILIIDDDRSMCEVLESELRRREFEVTWVTAPHEAIALFEREDFGLAITDVNMAGMSGVELCKQLVG